MARPMFSPEELEELRRFDEELDEDFVQTQEEIVQSRKRDRAAAVANMEPKKRKIAEYQAAYREANKDKIAEYQAAYREANRDKYKAYQREYQRRLRERLQRGCELRQLLRLRRQVRNGRTRMGNRRVRFLRLAGAANRDPIPSSGNMP